MTEAQARILIPLCDRNNSDELTCILVNGERRWWTLEYSDRRKTPSYETIPHRTAEALLRKGLIRLYARKEWYSENGVIVQIAQYYRASEKGKIEASQHLARKLIRP